MPIGGMLPDRLTGAVEGRSATFLVNICDSVSYLGTIGLVRNNTLAPSAPATTCLPQ